MSPLFIVPQLAFLANLLGADMVILLLVPLFLCFWVWILVDAITKEPKEGSDRLIWVIVIVMTQIVGAAIYYFVRRPERIRKYGQ